MGCGASTHAQGKYEALPHRAQHNVSDTQLGNPPLQCCEPGRSLTYFLTMRFNGAFGIYGIYELHCLENGKFRVVSNRILDDTWVVREGKVMITSRGTIVPLADDGKEVVLNNFNRYVPVSHVKLTDVTSDFLASMMSPHSQPVISQSDFLSAEGSLMAALMSGTIRLLRGTFIEKQWAARQPIPMRQDLPDCATWPPDEAASMWADYGPSFLLALSYAWITAEHPDPHLYHLERVARIVSEYRACLPMFAPLFKSTGVIGPTVSEVSTDVGVFWDYPSLPQRNASRQRNPEEERVFHDGIKQVNLLYGHTRTTVLRCKSLPSNVKRHYDDRGWPLFEVCVSDSKPASDLKVFVFDDTFEANTQTSGLQFFSAAIHGHSPPRKPEQFQEELKVRGERASARNQSLFTNGKDNPFVVQKYSDVWSELCVLTSLKIDSCQWSTAEIRSFCDVLPKYIRLQELNMTKISLGDSVALLSQSISALPLHVISFIGCGVDHNGASALASVIGRMPLKLFNLQYSPVGDAGVAAIWGALPSSIEFVGMDRTGAKCGAFEMLASRIPSLPNLHTVFMSASRPGAKGSKALADAISGSAIRTLNLFDCDLEGVDIERLRLAWTAAGRTHHSIELSFNEAASQNTDDCKPTGR